MLVDNTVPTMSLTNFDYPGAQEAAKHNDQVYTIFSNGTGTTAADRIYMNYTNDGSEHLTNFSHNQGTPGNTLDIASLTTVSGTFDVDITSADPNVEINLGSNITTNFL